MAVTEKQRHEFMKQIEETLGPEHAETLMELLPPVGWADVATKHDLDALGAATKRDLDALGAETKRDFDELGAATKRDFDELGAATKRDIGALEAATKADLGARSRRPSTRWGRRRSVTSAHSRNVSCCGPTRSSSRRSAACGATWPPGCSPAWVSRPPRWVC